jgi:hypothetical protein
MTMTERLTDDEIRALRRLRSMATMLPWATGDDANKPEPCGRDDCIHAADGVPILEVLRDGLDGDAAYVVAACNAIDRLLDEIEERRRIDPKVVAFFEGVQV